MGCGVVYLTLKSKFGTVLLLHTVTPLEPFLQKYSVVAYSDWWIPTFLVKWLVQAYDVQVCAATACNRYSMSMKPNGM